MPLEELTEIGYEIQRAPPDTPPGDNVWGYGRQWRLFPGDDEQKIVDEARNHKALHDKLEQAQAYFADNYANWATMTAGQKDAANRQAQRGLANLIRHVRSDLSGEGV
jgi:hypothetical protein